MVQSDIVATTDVCISFTPPETQGKISDKFQAVRFSSSFTDVSGYTNPYLFDWVWFS
jgi:hypothetical protein